MFLNVPAWACIQACVKQMVALVFSSRMGCHTDMPGLPSHSLETKTEQEKNDHSNVI